MGTFFQYTPEEMFDDEFYDCIYENTLNSMLDIYKPQIGDCVIYDPENDNIYLHPYKDDGTFQRNNVIGIVVQMNDDGTVDCIMKNYLTTEKQIISLKSYIVSNVYSNTNAASAYMKQLFDRYNSKFKNTCNMEFVKSLRFYVPNIAQMDYVYSNKEKIYDTISKVFSQEKADEFINRLYNGILSSYKSKLYVWLPIKNKKREIKNISETGYCEFLSWFTISY